MAAHGHVHRTKKVDHLFVRDPELACHVMNTKLAQTCLLSRARRASQPTGARPRGCRQRANAARKISIQNTDSHRGLATYRRTQFGGRRHLQCVNATRVQQRNHLFQAMPRGVQRHYRKAQPAAKGGLAHLLHTDYRGASPYTQSYQPQELSVRLLVQRQSSPSGVTSPAVAVPSALAASAAVEVVSSPSALPEAASSAPESSPLSPSSVSSLSMPTSCSASSSESPGIPRKSSRSRSMMSLSVR